MLGSATQQTTDDTSHDHIWIYVKTKRLLNAIHSIQVRFDLTFISGLQSNVLIYHYDDKTTFVREEYTLTN